MSYYKSRQGRSVVNTTWKRLKAIVNLIWLNDDIRWFLFEGKISTYHVYSNVATTYNVIDIPVDDFAYEFLYEFCKANFGGVSRAGARNFKVKGFSAKVWNGAERLQVGRPKGKNGRAAETFRRSSAKLEWKVSAAKKELEKQKIKEAERLKRLNEMSDAERLMREHALRRQRKLRNPNV